MAVASIRRPVSAGYGWPASLVAPDVRRLRVERGPAVVCWLGEPGADDLALVGGKAANLSRLAAAQRVPPGFTLVTQAFDAARRVAAEDGQLFVSEPLRRRIAAAYVELSRRAGEAVASVAVRSSAVDEDNATLSFAGQHETYLNVVGAEAVVDAIERCWESAVSERARAYRAQMGLADQQVSLAVLVQLLVKADVSAAAFSANPVTGARDEVLINASWGLGESIVGGTVTPDTYVVRRDDGLVARRDVADKARMTVLTPDGTAEVDVPRLLRRRPALADSQIAALTGLVLDLEQSMGWPVDVEAAFHGDDLYLLQCRPITTLESKSEKDF